MSLDVWLEGEMEAYECPHCGQPATRETQLFSANITHNLGPMAEEAGIYMACWRPEEIGVSKASELVPILETGLAVMKADPARFRAFDSPNGWGLYANFVPWVEKYLAACREHPEARVEVSR